MKPPIGGPTTGPSSAGMVSQAIAATSSVFAAVRSSSSRPTGTIIAPPMPCRTRAADQESTRPFDRPHRIEPMVNTDDGGAEHGAGAEPVGDPAAGRDEHRRLSRYDVSATFMRTGS